MILASRHVRKRLATSTAMVCGELACRGIAGSPQEERAMRKSPSLGRRELRALRLSRCRLRVGAISRPQRNRICSATIGSVVLAGGRHISVCPLHNRFPPRPAMPTPSLTNADYCCHACLGISIQRCVYLCSAVFLTFARPTPPLGSGACSLLGGSTISSYCSLPLSAVVARTLALENMPGCRLPARLGQSSGKGVKA